ncbi:MAG TPA: DUF4136 domain-containing protein [Gammaproteobacteria bacterium]
MNTRWIAVPLLGVALTAAHAAKPKIEWDKSYDFSAAKTFQWRDTDSPLATSNPLMHSRVVADIERQLAMAGLMEVEQNPDVYVTYHTSTEQNVRLESDAWGYGFGGYGTGAWGAWGYGYNGPTSVTTDVVTYDTGTLVVDIWDADRMELVWRASYSKVFSDDPEKAGKQVDAAIEAMAERWKKLSD